MKPTIEIKRYIIDSWIEWKQQIDIASELGIKLHYVFKAIRDADDFKIYLHWGKIIRICNSCKNHKEETEENFEKVVDKDRYYFTCLDCQKTLDTVAKLQKKVFSTRDEIQCYLK